MLTQYMSLNVSFADRSPMWFIMVHHGSSFCGKIFHVSCPFHVAFRGTLDGSSGESVAVDHLEQRAQPSSAKGAKGPRGQGAKALTLRSSGMATDLAEEQRGVAQRCGTEAAEDWGLTRHDTTRRVCQSTFEILEILEFLRSTLKS